MKQVQVDGIWKRKVVLHVGTAKSDLDLSLLLIEANKLLGQLEKPDELRFDFSFEIATSALRKIGDFRQSADLVLGQLYDRLEIGIANVELLSLLVIARLLQPGSKKRTVEFLNKCPGVSLDLDQVYRYMDTMANRQDEILSATKKYLLQTFPGSFGYVLYDVTTLYFETDKEDEDTQENLGLRKKGYSKEKEMICPR
jgi:hypothetical protein